jgi:hypothetical protein
VPDEQAPPVFEVGGQWPFVATVKVNGHALASVSSWSVSAASDGVPVVTLGLVDQGALGLLLGPGARVLLSDATREALVSLGWTPPAG